MITKIETNLKSNKYFNTTTNISFSGKLNHEEYNLIIVYPDIQYQKLLGFGGAFTESSGYALSRFKG